MGKLRLQEMDLKGKKVLVRVDFNVPLQEDGAIADDTRIRESIPSIQHILNAGGCVILMSHLDRPKGVDPRFSLKPCAAALAGLLGQPVLMAEDCIGDQVKEVAQHLAPGQVLLLENLRFHAAEEKPDTDPSFAKKLAALGDVYVNDAFGTAHRAHSSTALIASFFPGKAAAGFLLQKEIESLGTLLSYPKRPFYALIGGAKISSKIGVLKALISKVDGLFIGGGMAFTFYRAKGIRTGNSLCEENQIQTAEEILKECSQKGVPLHLPEDLIIADAFSNDANQKTIDASQGIPDGWQGMDIGPKTLNAWSQEFKNACTIFWNGPLGVFEFPRFSKGTDEIAEILAHLNAITIVGGGDSVAAINRLKLKTKFTHLSTGGGASLEYIEFGHLPGIDALSDPVFVVK
jgi:phosphoglycerate kinase